MIQSCMPLGLPSSWTLFMRYPGTPWKILKILGIISLSRAGKRRPYSVAMACLSRIVLFVLFVLQLSRTSLVFTSTEFNKTLLKNSSFDIHLKAKQRKEHSSLDICVTTNRRYGHMPLSIKYHCIRYTESVNLLIFSPY